jgi:hypothetical protein
MTEAELQVMQAQIRSLGASEYIRKNMLNRAVAIGTLLAAATACAHAQWLNYLDPRTPRTKDGKPNLTAPTPRASDGKPDLSGVWEGEPTPHGEVTQVLGEHFYDLQIDVEDNSKYTFNLLWDLQPEEELLRPEAAAFLKEGRGRSHPARHVDHAV